MFNYFSQNFYMIGVFLCLIIFGYRSRKENIDVFNAGLIAFFLNWLYIAWFTGQLIFDKWKKDAEENSKS